MSAATLTVASLSDALTSAARALVADLKARATQYHDEALAIEHAALLALHEAERVKRAALEARTSLQRVEESARQARELLLEDAAAAVGAAQAADADLSGKAPQPAADPCEPRPAGAPAAEPEGEMVGFVDPLPEATPELREAARASNVQADEDAQEAEVTAAANEPVKVTERIAAGESSASIAAALLAEEGVSLSPADPGKATEDADAVSRRMLGVAAAGAGNGKSARKRPRK